MRMSIAAPDASAAPDETLDPSVARAERRLRLLEELSEIGMELARGLKPRADVGDAVAGEASGKDPAAIFAPLSRAIRLTLALEARTDQALRDLKAGVECARREARAKAVEHDGEAREAQVRALVLEVAERECENYDAFEDLEEALEERLDLDEAYAGCRVRPLRQTVERLCQDLGLSPDWSRWAGEGWLEEETPTRARFSPFNQPSPRPLLSEDGGPPPTALAGGPSGRLHPTPALE